MAHEISPSQYTGVLISTPLENDRVVTQATVSCCHCRRVWLVQPGSGRRRGFCQRCMGITCGSVECHECLPFEAWLENVEAGRPENFRRIIGHVDAEPPRG